MKKLILASIYLSLMACIAEPAPPQPLLPKSGDTASGDSLIFYWSRVNKANNYRLEIASNRFFNNPALDSTVSDTSYLLNLEVFTSPLTGQKWYYWRIASVQETPSPWSETDSFFNNNPARP